MLAEAGGVWRAGTPTFTPGGSPPIYTTEQTIAITSATPEATVRYTLDGSEPDASDAVVPSGGLVIDQSRTISARAWKTGHAPSGVATATYTLRPSTPAISPGSGTYTSPRSVTLTSATPGVTIRYTTDGSAPTSSSPAYTAAIPVATTTTLKATAFRTGWDDSTTATATLAFHYGTLETPVVSPGGGTYSADQTVSLAVPNGPSGTILRYTTNGTTPGTSSPLYSGPITVASALTVKARAFHPDWTSSAIASETYAFTAATPTFTQASGTYPAGQVVAIATSTPNATIRYTLTGVAPTASDPVYLPGTTLTLGDYTLTAAAWKTGYTTSAPATASYQIEGDVTPAQIATGETHTLVVARDSSVWSFGSNGWGYLGDGSTTARSQPVRVAGLSGIADVAGGAQHSLAVGLDGRVFSWGANSSGQQGDGSTTGYRAMPVPVTAVTNAVAVAAGQHHSLALTNTGHVVAWGANANGQLGLATTTTQPTPTIVPSLSDIAGIAAGSTHSFAWTTSGVLYAWGSNTSGKLDDGTTTQRTSPVLIAGIPGVVAVAAGTHHSLALTTTGALYAWGRNAEGQVGDGTTTNRTVPTLVSSLAGVQAIGAGANHSLASTATTYGWGANASSQTGDGQTTNRTSPTATTFGATVQLAGGTVHSVGLDAAGAVWTWGGGGAGQLGTGGTTTQGTPAPISGGGQTWGVAAPTPDVAPGTYDAEPAVTLTSLTPGATIRYTTTGSDPVDTDPIASGPIAITQTATTLKAKAWKGTLAPSAVTSAVYTLQPAAPSADPSGGQHATPQTVSVMTTTSGATIRYTLDGTAPGPASPEYAGPLTIATTTTLKAAAFRAGWIPSETLAELYTVVVDTRPPTITARIRPGVNAAAWTMGPAEVTFICYDHEGPVQSCTAPIAVPTETDGHAFAGTATDQAGLEAHVSGVVKVDATPPVLAMTAPADGVEVSTATVTLTGTASDAMSGLAAVRCNDVAATVSNGIVTCDVPLRPGRNPVVLQASDVAGHSTSIGIVVWRTAPLDRLTLSPEQATLHEGDEVPLRLVNNMGRVQTGATWTVSDPAVAEVDETSEPTLRALAPGSATVTATVGGLTATATVTVVGQTVVFVPGTTRWLVQALPGMTLDEVIYTHQTSPDVPEAVLVESVGADIQLRGVSDGVTTSLTPVAGGPPRQTMGDSFGGVLLLQGDDGLGPTTLQRVGFTPAVTPWRWVGAGPLSGIVQIHDGTIFATERVLTAEGGLTAAAVVVLDGATGTVRARVPITAPTYDNYWISDGSSNCEQEPGDVRQGIGVTELWALTTADVYGVVTEEHTHVAANCPEGGGTSRGSSMGAQHLLTVDRAGATTTEQLSHYGETFPSNQGSFSTPKATELARDARGNFVLTLENEESEVVGPEPGAPALPVTESVLVSADGVYVVSTGTSVEATDLLTNQTLWSAPSSAQPVAIIRGFASDPNTRRVVVLEGSSLKIVGPGASPEVADLGEVPSSTTYEGGNAYHVLGSLGYRKVYGPSVAIEGLELLTWIEGRLGSPQRSGDTRSPGWNHNFSRIELETEAPAQVVFDTYVPTYYGINSPHSSMGTASFEGGLDRVTGIGQKVTFTLATWEGYLQPPFSVRIVRFDPANRVMTAYTEPFTLSWAGATGECTSRVRLLDGSW